MKKIILLNVLFCILVIFISNYYFNSKSKEAIAYFYAENNIETNYFINKNNLEPKEITYRFGMGLFEIEIIDVATEKLYFFEVDITDDFTLYYIKDLTDLYNRNLND